MIKTKSDKIALIILIIFLWFVFIGVKGSFVSNQSNQAHNFNVLQERAEAVEKFKTQNHMEKMRRVLGRDYGTDLYYEDFSETKERMNREFAESLNKVFGEGSDRRVIIKGGVVLYNKAYKKAQSENLSLEAMLLDVSENVKCIDAEIYCIDTYFTRQGNREMLYRKLNEFYKPFKEMELDQSEFTIRIYHEEILDEIDIDVAKEREDFEVLLNNHDNYKLFNNICGNNEISYESVARLESRLEAKYGEEFICVNKIWRPYFDDGGYSFHVFSPVRDLSVEFDSKRDDKYLMALAQKKIGASINEIIDNGGATEKLVQFTSLEGYDSREIIPTEMDDKSFIDAYVYSAEISLYYLHEYNERMDYEKILEVVKAVRAEYQSSSKYSLSIFFYEVKELDRRILVDLFNKNLITENTFEKKRNPNGVAEGRYKVRTETEGFNYLDVYGKKMDYMLEIYSMEAYEEMGARAFVEKYKKKDTWRREY